jgi:uncharacterized surface protein with fasciclin (FAS1) repeats
MKRLLLSAILAFALTLPALAQSIRTGWENGKRVAWVPIGNGETRKIYLDYRNCEELLGRATCDAMGMTNMRPPSEPNDVRPSTPESGRLTRGSTIADLAIGDPRFSRLVELLQMAGLAETLAGEGPFTVFAPTNDAFERANQSVLRAIVADRTRLRNLLMYHVVRGRYDARTLNNRAGSAPGFTEQTLAGPLPTAAAETGYTIGGVRPVAVDIAASNGLIHAIDVLIRPPSENNLRD